MVPYSSWHWIHPFLIWKKIVEKAYSSLSGSVSESDSSNTFLDDSPKRPRPAWLFHTSQKTPKVTQVLLWFMYNPSWSHSVILTNLSINIFIVCTIHILNGSMAAISTTFSDMVFFITHIMYTSFTIIPILILILIQHKLGQVNQKTS